MLDKPGFVARICTPFPVVSCAVTSADTQTNFPELGVTVFVAAALVHCDLATSFSLGVFYYDKRKGQWDKYFCAHGGT